MKKTINYAYVLVLAVVLLTACDQTNEVITDRPIIEEKDLFVTSGYNSDMKNFALAVSKAMNKSKDFRSLLKSQALARFDGDYDVLLTQIVDKPVAAYDGASLRSSNGTCTVRDLLADSYPTSALRSTGSGASVINELSGAYPDLQVSIPVHAEEWDESTIPVVAFVPEEYEDCVTPYVAGYDANGNLIAVDALTPPDKPVAVIGQNERRIRLPLDRLIPEHLPEPTNLTATSTQSGILLVWEMSSSVAADVVGYKIYRKGHLESNYTLLAINNGFNNRSHNDVVYNPGATYSYYVTAYNFESESFGSNIASAAAAAQPEGPTSFEAILNTNTEVELRWTTNPNAYIDKLELSRYVLNQTNGYEWYRDFTRSEFRYFDQNITQGAKIRYELQAINAIGPSNPLYDMVKIPYRNPSLNSPVRIKKISCGELEGWLMGAPELVITICGVDESRKTTKICSRQIDMSSNTKTYNNPLWLLDWKPDSWYQIYTFYVVEEDPGKDVDINITANIGVKKTVAKGVIDLGVEASISKKFSFSKPEDCGSADLNYFDPTDITLRFRGEHPNHKCDITLCE